MTIDPGPKDWEAQEPPADFADRVMARIADEGAGAAGAGRPLRARSHRRPVAAGVASVLALAAAVAIGVGAWDGHRRSARGDAIAADRREVRLGDRAVAVLEKGAHVAWNGDDVMQPAGDVFYRVERGAAFRVHTPAGDVQVLGTCFRVRLESGGSAASARGEDKAEEPMNVHGLKEGAIGAAIGAAALVTVYEGKVALSPAGHGGDAVTLTAGESARADGRGVARVGSTDGSQDALGATGDGDPLLAANANLADSVREYKRRLERIEAQKATLDKQLADAQRKLRESERDGKAGEERSSYDLTPADWKELAEEGTVRARFPCIRANDKDHDMSELAKLGLPPQDGPVLQTALAASRARIWATIKPLCVSALVGDTVAAEKLGPSTCEDLIRETAQTNGADVDEEMRAVAEMRAGTRPIPADGGDAVTKVMLLLTGEASRVEKEIAAQIGPDDAKRLVFGDDTPACWSNSSWTSGPKPKVP